VRLRIATPLPADLEQLAQRVIGSCIHVHTALGPGLQEVVYSRSLARELTIRRIECEAEYIVPVYYRDEIVSHHRIDLFVERRLIVETKAIERLAPIHTAQVLSYLRVTGARLGLLVNFNTDHVRSGIRRVIL
jgi:GxxExxY protein